MKTIKECRDSVKMSLSEIADKMFIGETFYLDFEDYKDEMTIEQGMQFSKITGIPIDEIIFFAE